MSVLCVAIYSKASLPGLQRVLVAGIRISIRVATARLSFPLYSPVGGQQASGARVTLTAPAQARH